MFIIIPHFYTNIFQNYPHVIRLVLEKNGKLFEIGNIDLRNGKHQLTYRESPQGAVAKQVIVFLQLKI